MLAYTYYYAYTKHIIHYTCEPTFYLGHLVRATNKVK